MNWYEVELEIPIYGKNFETIQAPDKDSAIKIAIKINTHAEIELITLGFALIQVKSFSAKIA